MEALAAISLAGNILQFLQFAKNLVSESSEIYHSLSGTTKELESLEESCKYTLRQSKNLVPPQSPDVLAALPPAQIPIQAEIDLARLALKCKKASDELYRDLKALHLDGSSHGKAASFRQSFRNYLGKPRIKRLQKTVESCREDLMFCLVAVTNQKQSGVLKHLEDLQKTKLTLVHDHSAKLDQISDLIQDVNGHATKLLKANDDNVLLESLSRELEIIEASADRQWISEHSIVETLFDLSIPVRHQSIPVAHKDTFDWLLSKRVKQDARAQYPESTLLNWLGTGTGVYWISGKPGSGKSTLMKFIADHPQTQAALNEWAGANECISAAYYFWSAGTRLQKSIEGLLRSLLFDIFVWNPKLMPIAVPERWASLNAKTQTRFYQHKDDWMQRPWTVSDLSNALYKLSSHNAITQRFCLFVDGLDEYHGEHRDVVKILLHLSTGRNFKLCLSSRPWNVFEDTLGLNAAQKLYLHDLTRNDIQQYTASTLQEDSNWRTGALIDPRYSKLTEDITEKAQGVFLWVVLVVRSVLEGLSNGDSIKLLERRMEAIPQELGPFFRHILFSISPLYHRQMALYFQVALEAPQALTLMHYSFLDKCFESDQSAFQDSVRPMDNHDIFKHHMIMRRRLNARCKGLLEAHLNPSESCAYLAHTVTFLHRTVRDFLLTDEMAQFLEEILGGYQASTIMLMAYVAFIKALPADGPIMPLLKEALVYAGKAEKESKEMTLACLDELHHAVIESGLMDPQSSEMSLLAVQNGLSDYVSESIKAGVVGFESPSALLDHALTSSHSTGADQADMVDMTKLLLANGATFSNEKWSDYLQDVSVSREGIPRLELALRYKSILGVLLPLVDNVNTLSEKDVAWGNLFMEIVSDEWETIPRNVANTRTEMVQMLFSHSANPNVSYSHGTIWTIFSSYLRKINRRSAAGVLQPHQRGHFIRNLVQAETLAKFTEMLVNAGADLEREGSITPKEVNQRFPPRLASRITEAMRRQAQLASPHLYTRWTSWAGEMLSWAWNPRG